jgi:hypothetical protein
MRTLGCFLLRRNMKVRMANSPVPHGFFRFGGNPLEYRLYGNGPWAAPTPWGSNPDNYVARNLPGTRP